MEFLETNRSGDTAIGPYQCEGGSDEEVWLFFLSNDFISKTVVMIEEVLDGLGSSVGERRKALQELK